MKSSLFLGDDVWQLQNPNFMSTTNNKFVLINISWFRNPNGLEQYLSIFWRDSFFYFDVVVHFRMYHSTLPRARIQHASNTRISPR